MCGSAVAATRASQLRPFSVEGGQFICVFPLDYKGVVQGLLAAGSQTIKRQRWRNAHLSYSQAPKPGFWQRQRRRRHLRRFDRLCVVFFPIRQHVHPDTFRLRDNDRGQQRRDRKTVGSGPTNMPIIARYSITNNGTISARVLTHRAQRAAHLAARPRSQVVHCSVVSQVELGQQLMQRARLATRLLAARSLSAAALVATVVRARTRAALAAQSMQTLPLVAMSLAF